MSATSTQEQDVQYRVEMQDGTGRWSFGIRLNPDRHLPETCSLDRADRVSLQAARALRDWAVRTQGGTLRVRKVSQWAPVEQPLP